MNGQPVYLAIDIGTGSVRVGLFTTNGEKLAYDAKPISTRNPRPDYYEQSTQDIWRSTIHCIKSVIKGLQEENSDKYVAAIGIDATCSLVACKDDEALSPLSVSAHDVNDSNDALEHDDQNDDVYNVMLWLDRRAINEAAEINEMKDEAVKSVVSHFGGIISPENEPPKLLWLARHRGCVIREGIFFDLADWLAVALTGRRDARSSCTTACKWGWGATERGKWNGDFWRALDLEPLTADGFKKIGTNIIYAGCSIGSIQANVAEMLGLPYSCVVAAPMVDAYAGCLWSLGVNVSDEDATQRLNMVCGTSTCFLQLSREPLFVKGVWGPFADAILRGMHVTEGGQSVTGKLLEHTVRQHAGYNTLCNTVGVNGVYDALAEKTNALLAETGIDPTTHVHCLDYHAGNRSPLADPTLKGCFVGLTLATDPTDLATVFRATVQALCYGARHVVDAMRQAGHDMRVIAACGGLCKSRLFLTELADCLSMPVLLCKEGDTVLLGGAILAKLAHSIGEDDSNCVDSMVECAQAMSTTGEMIKPNRKRLDFHTRKYSVYRKMYDHYLEYRSIMDGGIQVEDKS